MASLSITLPSYRNIGYASLPSSVLRLFLSHLCTSEMVLCQRVCRAWNRISFPETFQLGDSRRPAVYPDRSQLTTYILKDKFCFVRNLKLFNLRPDSEWLYLFGHIKISLVALTLRGFKRETLTCLSAITQKLLTTIDFSYSEITCADLEQLNPNGLQSVNLAYTEITQSLSFLTRLSLIYLNLGGCKINDHSLSFLPRSLQTLLLYPDKDTYDMAPLEHITGSGFCHLLDMPLKRLSLRFLQIPNEKLQKLETLALETLDLAGNHLMSDAALLFFAKMPMTSLDLSNTALEGTGLQHLVRMPLKKLSIFAVSCIQDIHLSYLLTLPLNILEHTFTKITKEGAARLIERRPDLKINNKNQFLDWDR